MNKKVLSAILFCALFAGTGTFTSCIDNDEPAGIEELRGAKAELIRAKVAVEQANASFILAQAEVEKAKAAKENALAEIEKANAEYQKLLNEYQEAANEAYKAEIAANLETAKQTAAEAALRHQKTILALETQLAKAQREYEITMKQIEIAKALMNEGDLQTIEDLEDIVDGKQGAVNTAMVAVKTAEMEVYTAAMNLEADSEWWAEKLALDLKYAEAGLAAAEEAVEIYKNYLDNLENADWYAEMKEIKAELTVIEKKKDSLDVAKTKELNSDEHMALVNTLKVANETYEALAAKASKTAEKLTYTYKYLGTDKNVKKEIAANTAMTDAVEEIAGADFLTTGEYAGFIAELKNDIASYTEEYKAYLDGVAENDVEEGLAAAKKASDEAIADWKKKLADYNDALANAKDLKTTVAENAYATFKAAMDAADELSDANEKAKAQVKAEQAFADALVAYYETIPSGQATMNKLTLKLKKMRPNGEQVEYYATKTAKEWLSDAENKDIYLNEILKQCFTWNGTERWYGFWSNGEEEKFEVEDVEYTTSYYAFGTWKSAADFKGEKLVKLNAASNLAFGDATGYIDQEYVKKAEYKEDVYTYLTVQPSEADVEYVGYEDAGEYGAYLGYQDEDNVWLAKNYKDIVADYEAAIEYWTAAVEDMVEALGEYSAELEAAKTAVKTAEKALADANDAIDAKYAVIEDTLAQKEIVLNNIYDKLEQYVDVETNGYETVEQWLAAAVKGAEYYVINAKEAVVKVEQNLKKAEDGKFDTALALEKAQQDLTAATEQLEKAQAELAEALADLQTALEIMSAE